MALLESKPLCIHHELPLLPLANRNVFEASIRALGSLLSAHLLILESHAGESAPLHPSLAGVVLAPGYAGQLLDLALDLGQRYPFLH